MKKELIEKRVAKFRAKTVIELSKTHLQRQQRLKDLVDEYGVTDVAHASGLSEKTVIQYCRVKVPPQIGETPIRQAEVVLKGE